jgi:hypothetical protein
MNWLEMRVRHGIRPLIPVLMLVILPHHLQTLAGMAMGPPPKILFDFEIDDTFLKHGSLSVKQYERRKIWVYMYVLWTPPASSEFLRVRKAFSRMPVYTRYQGRNLPKDTVGGLYTGSHARSRSRGLPLPGSCPRLCAQ